MTRLRPITERPWPAGLAMFHGRLLASVRTPGLEAEIHNSLTAMVPGVEHFHVYEIVEGNQCRLRCCHHEPGIQKADELSVRRWCRTDPFHDAFRDSPCASALALLRLDVNDAMAEAFRRCFYRQCEVFERVWIAQRGDRCWRVLNVARQQGCGHFDDEEIASLAALGNIMLPMLALDGADLLRVSGTHEPGARILG